MSDEQIISGQEVHRGIERSPFPQAKFGPATCKAVRQVIVMTAKYSHAHTHTHTHITHKSTHTPW